MAATSGTVANGSKIYYSTDGISYTRLTEVKEIPGPKVQFADVDFTHLDNDNYYEEHKPGMARVQPFTLPCHFIYSQHSAVYTHAEARTNLYWRIETSDVSVTQGTRHEGRGFIVDFDLADAKRDTPLMQSITIMPTGRWTKTAPA